MMELKSALHRDYLLTSLLRMRVLPLNSSLVTIMYFYIGQRNILINIPVGEEWNGLGGELE